HLIGRLEMFLNSHKNTSVGRLWTLKIPFLQKDALSMLRAVNIRTANIEAPFARGEVNCTGLRMDGMEIEVKSSAEKSCQRDEDDGAFHCVICMELAYKPIVQACGHVFCFWCVHQAMSGVGVSHCPLCRSPYKHFPRVCELLHYLLLKAYPEDYKQRAEEVL
ncbi:hypothetical protein KI387_002203, partial [Taxus chinensis]